MTLSSKT